MIALLRRREPVLRSDGHARGELQLRRHAGTAGARLPTADPETVVALARAQRPVAIRESEIARCQAEADVARLAGREGDPRETLERAQRHPANPRRGEVELDDLVAAAPPAVGDMHRHDLVSTRSRYRRRRITEVRVAQPVPEGIF